MITSRTTIIVLTIAAGLLLLTPAPLHAARTDIVVLANGDRITGEAIQLRRGQLQFKTDDAGTLQIEWDKVRRLEANREFEVATRAWGWTCGRRRRPPSGRAWWTRIDRRCSSGQAWW